MGNTTSSMFGGDDGVEVDWRGIPVQKEATPGRSEREVLEERIRFLESQVEAMKKQLVDSEGAD